ncbi:hypothetical protein HO173_007249 [Letharia columbiana]|uniref:Uncharacterized protein n=1 Tax=Letharia columbiana TaxID=112416 RepID=A0A8H6FTU8_9LECA|nr:uncharacterized protein HO173_007249 [Letharia columbiana]KAF6234623.1 hypothetical protein HO173_007249 [Letharia columbiana]
MGSERYGSLLEATSNLDSGDSLPNTRRSTVLARESMLASQAARSKQTGVPERLETAPAVEKTVCWTT